MRYVTIDDYVGLYGDESTVMTIEAFNRLGYEAERFVDAITTGVDNVHKLDVAYPINERDAEAVKMCILALIHTLHEARIAADTALGNVADSNGRHGAISSVSSGSESISYATGGTYVHAMNGDMKVKQATLMQIARQYLSGVTDKNGVNILYMGVYPYHV